MPPSRLSKPRRVPIALSLSLFCGLGLAACGTVQAPTTPIVPQAFREPCKRPDPSSVATVGDLASFSIRQDAALSVCDSARSALVQIIDGIQPKPKRKLWPW